MSEAAEIARHTALIEQSRQAQYEGSSTETILQSLMVDDSALKRILEGDIQQLFDKFMEFTSQAAALGAIDKTLGTKILLVLEKIQPQLVRYRRLLPYVMLLSHLTHLSNVGKEEAEDLKNEVGIMICRDLLDIEEDELDMTDINFFEAIGIMYGLAISDSVEGWKAGIVTVQKRLISQEFVDKSPRKKRLGIF